MNPWLHSGVYETYHGGGVAMLTDAKCRNAKSGDLKIKKLADRDGLYLWIYANGRKYWRLRYWFNKTEKSLSLGVYPKIGLKAAREACTQARQILDDGFDPAVKRKLEKITKSEAAQNTFQALAEEWLAKIEREGRTESTLARTKRLLSSACSIIGDRPIVEIEAPELLAVLRRYERQGKYESALRLRSTCGQVFRYAIATGRGTQDPSAFLRGALTVPTVKHRATILAPDAIGALMRAIDGYEGQPETRLALKLLALTFVRPGELRMAEWSEFDAGTREWRIPEARMKMRRPHRVPLADQTLALLKELVPLTGRGRFLFPSVRTFSRPMSENTLNAALRRLGYGTDDMTAHGFRAMAATRLNEMTRWPVDAIERQLAHQEQNEVRRAYTHGAEYWTDRVDMMQAWADYLDELTMHSRLAPFQSVLADDD